MSSRESVLEVTDLSVRFTLDDGVVKAVDGVSFRLERGRTIALVGESGSGKSVTSLAIMRLLEPGSADIGGSVVVGGKDVLALEEKEMCAVRGREVAMIFQDPMTSLNPFLRVGAQLNEVLEVHERLSRRQAKKKSLEMLARVGISDVERRFSQYPHQFSGGMRQRVMIAMALLCRPRVLIADEPTTALDVTIQAQILELMGELSRDLGTSMLFITHDLGVVAGIADEVAVMYAGRLVEKGPTERVLSAPAHPYTKALLRSVPRLDEVQELSPIPGAPPSPSKLPVGCAFHPRCPHVRAPCRLEAPPLEEIAAGHSVRCPFHDRLDEEAA